MANIFNADEILNAQANPSGNGIKEGQADWRVRDVLIVDDEEPLLLTIAEGLSIYKKYFNLLTATNGADAVKVLKSSPGIDLVLTDLSMPKMDGFELLAYMNRNYPKIPVILMTAFGTPKIEEIVSSMGIYGYLEKPLDINIIADNIFAALAIKSGPADSAMRDVRNRELNKTSYVSGFFNSDDYKKTMP
ncbi:MAG: response regulator [Smithellaceae bacterium]